MINAKQWIPFFSFRDILDFDPGSAFIYLSFIFYLFFSKIQLNWFENMAQHDRWYGTWNAVGGLVFSFGQDELFRCDMKHKACELIPLNEPRIQWEKKNTIQWSKCDILFTEKPLSTE